LWEGIKLDLKKKVIYVVVLILFGVVVGLGVWIYGVGSANIWGGKGQVEQESQGTVKEDDERIYVEVFVDHYESITGTLKVNNDTYHVITDTGTISIDDENVIAIKSAKTGRLIDDNNAKWYNGKPVIVVVKTKKRLVINPNSARDTVFIDPVTKQNIPPDMLKDYVGKSIIVIRKLTKPAVWLIAGIDSRNGIFYGHNDSVMLAFVNPITSSITLLAIPRDTIVYIPRLKSYTKLGHAFIYSNAYVPQDGALSLVETIEYNFGVKVDRYIMFSFKGVADVIDAIGGIDVYLEKRVCCSSHDWVCRGGTCLGPGDVHLDGKKFLVFWRARTSDIERVNRQLGFLTSKEIKDQIIGKLSLSIVDDLIKIWDNEVVSDASPDKWIKLAYDIKDYNVVADYLKVYDVWGCYAADLEVKVSALKFDENWLKDFYIRVFGDELASSYIENIHPDSLVGEMDHCKVEEETEEETASTTMSSGTGTATGSTSSETTTTSTTSTASTTSSTSTTSTTSMVTSTTSATSTTSTTSIGDTP